MRVLTLLINSILIAATTTAIAQSTDKSGLRKLIDHYSDIIDNWGSYDTLYLEKTPKRLRLKASLIATGTRLNINGINNQSDYSAELESDNKYTLSVGASYRILSFSLSMNPAKLFGKYNDFEITFDAYGNRLGGDILYQTANSFKGNVLTDNLQQAIDVGVAKQKLLILNGYYAFNCKKFSFPAAFARQWEQKKSCGSVIAGLSVLYRDLSIANDDYQALNDIDISTWCIGIGVGYGYNFALRGNWLLHVSTLPEFVVFNRSKTVIDGEENHASPDFPNIIAVGRLGAGKTFSRYFAGMNAVVNVSSIGNTDELQIENVKWQANVYVGMLL